MRSKAAEVPPGSSHAQVLLQVLPAQQPAAWCGACRYSICNQPVEPQDPSPGHVRKVQARFLELHKVLDIKVRAQLLCFTTTMVMPGWPCMLRKDTVLQEFLSGWFLGAPFESIRRGNVLAFAAYAFYGRSLQQLPLQVGPPFLHVRHNAPPRQSACCMLSSSVCTVPSFVRLAGAVPAAHFVLQEVQHLQEGMARAEQLWGTKLLPGFNPDVKVCSWHM